MAEPSEEERLRERVRKSLEEILHEGGERSRPDAPASGADPSHVQAIVDEETERFWARQGYVKHTSRSGRVFWAGPC